MHRQRRNSQQNSRSPGDDLGFFVGAVDHHRKAARLLGVCRFVDYAINLTVCAEYPKDICCGCFDFYRTTLLSKQPRHIFLDVVAL